MTKNERIAELERKVEAMAAQILALQMALSPQFMPSYPSPYMPYRRLEPYYDDTNPIPPGVYPWWSPVYCGAAS